MSTYVRNSLLYVGVVIIITAIVLLTRLESVRESFDWDSAVTVGTAKSYRVFLGKWRTGKYATDALEGWERALKLEYGQLDWTHPSAVEDFIRDHPEFQESEIRSVQYDAVIKDGSYEVLRRYLDKLPQSDSRRDAIMKCIDSIVMAEVRQAVKNDDFQKLRQLSDKYSDWKGREEWIDRQIPIALNNSAKVEWERLMYSRSEQDLRSFMNKYSGTTYATEALKRISALYDDFDFVKSKGTLKAYLDFADNHPSSPQVNEAWQHVADELERYVFKRKALGSNESLVRSTLARYKKARPYSGGLYGTGGYYTSPLQITTPFGSDDYFVKLVNKRTRGVVGIYVRGGTTTRVEVPDGTYSVRYATGSQWHGTRFLFGLDASYSKSGQDFTFNNGMGYKLTLQKVPHGNLHTSPMSASEF